MTKPINLFIALFILTVANPALSDARSLKPAQRKASPRLSLIERHREFIAATSRGDAEAMARLLAEDYAVIGADGQRAGRAKALAAVRGNGAGLEMADSDVEARLVGGAGVVTGLIKWKAGTATGSVRYTEVWRRKAGGWELLAAQATNVQEK